MTMAACELLVGASMKIVVVGNGGREHALAWKIRQSPLVTELYCVPGNAGMAALADCVPIDTTSIVEIADFVETVKADLTVVGPELPMVLGISDEFQRRGLTIFCPTRAAAELEGSKAFAREFMERHHIPAPRFAVCSSPSEAREVLQSGRLGYPVVVKADGLAAGKGTVIAKDLASATTAVDEIMAERRFGSAGDKLVLEECLEGEEVSFLVFSDGARVVPMVSAQDHKRAFDGDQGPNTGGMGAVSPATNVTLESHKRIMQDVIGPTISGMAAEGRPFRGVLYAGIMMTAQGPKVLEFNARFGDPETQAILARMRSDIVPLLLEVARGQLREPKIEWATEPAVCVVLASQGYPDAIVTGKKIEGLERLTGQNDVIVFHAATALRDGAVVTVGGRVLGVTALGATHEGAIARAYEAVRALSFDGMQYRTDIGHKALARLQAAKTEH
jgi:phosphoribosylamine---glycine ligase